MAENAVTVGGVAGFRPMLRIRWNSRDDVSDRLCALSEERRDFS
jgi:hypothetical protein